MSLLGFILSLVIGNLGGAFIQFYWLNMPDAFANSFHDIGWIIAIPLIMKWFKVKL